MTQRFSKSVFFQIKFEKTIMHLRPYKSSCIKHDIETYIYIYVQVAQILL